MSLHPRDLNRLAILLDVDGTLLDIAPTPREVVVPAGLPETLARVRDGLGGALALVSGRPIAELDEFFAPLRLAAVGGHGAEMRPVADRPALPGRVAPLDLAFRQLLTEIAATHPGVLVEDKSYSMALHYRLVPKQGLGLIHDVKRAYEAWFSQLPDRPFELLTGKAVIEIKRASFNKGTGVRELMTYPPFAGRTPIFVGDDRTDEDAFAVMKDFNGQAMSVGRRFPGIDKYFERPADVRLWLERLSGAVVVSSSV